MRKPGTTNKDLVVMVAAVYLIALLQWTGNMTPEILAVIVPFLGAYALIVAAVEIFDTFKEVWK